MTEKIDWVIHFVQGKEFCEQMCDAHTHGLNKYGSKELQIVLKLPPEIVGYIINAVGKRIRNGLVLHDGDYIDGLLENNVRLKIFETEDCSGKRIYRILIPDELNRFPGETDEYPYSMQMSSPETKHLS